MAINQNSLNMNFMNNMNPAALQAYQNMFNINPNYGMNDQMKLNAMLMNFMAMYKNPFMMNFQVFQPQGNMNNFNNGNNLGNLPRVGQRIFPNIDSYPGYQGKRINVIFETSTGIRINIAAPINETVQGLLIKFCERAGVSPLLLKKELVCIYNAIFIKPSNNITIGQFFKQNFGLNDQAKIIVIDAQNIIGA